LFVEVAEKWLEVIKEIFPLAAEIARKDFRKTKKEFSKKKDSHERVTETDRNLQNFILDKVSSFFPDFGVIAEEDYQKESKNGIFMVLDPLDGTHNFLRGIPWFALSVFLCHKDLGMLAGFTGEYISGNVAWAVRGKGSYSERSLPRSLPPAFAGVGINSASNEDQGFSPSSNKKENLSFENKLLLTALPPGEAHPGNWFLAFGFPYKTTGREKTLPALSRVAPLVLGLRRMGSSALDLSHTAMGIFDAYFEYSLNSWDIGAGLLLVEEAGGEIGFVSDGNKKWNIVVSRPGIWKPLVELLGWGEKPWFRHSRDAKVFVREGG